MPKRRTTGLHPSSRPNLTSRHAGLLDTRAERSLKSLPSRLHRKRGVEVRTNSTVAAKCAAESKIRSSPVCAGHAIKPLRGLIISPRAPAVLDRIEAIGLNAFRPLPDSSHATGFHPF